MYESSFSQEIQILLNGDCRDERHKRELQEMAISLASSIAAELLQKGVPVSLSGNLTDILSKEPVCCEAGVHKSHLEKMDRRLALADTGAVVRQLCRADQKEWERRETDKCYLVITAEDTEDIRAAVEAKRTAGEAVYGIIICREGESGPAREGFLWWEV